MSDAYLSLTVHWWQLSDALWVGGETSDRQGLYVKPLNSAHMTDKITATISEQLTSWIGSGGLTKGFLVTNGGSNMVVAAEHISCIAHLLHLMVKDALAMGSEEPWNAVAHEFWIWLQKCQHTTAHHRPFLLQH